MTYAPNRLAPNRLASLDGPAHPLPPGFVPQFQTVPSIRWQTINANHTPEITCFGHGRNGGIQLHSMDLGFARYGLVLQCVEGSNGRKLWQALKGDQVVFSHPKHDAALAGAVMILTGA